MNYLLHRRFAVRTIIIFFMIAVCALIAFAASNAKRQDKDKDAQQTPPAQSHDLLFKQSDADVAQKSTGCISCHTTTDSASMHPASDPVRIGCTDCHLGNASITLHGEAMNSAAYNKLKRDAHVQPRFAEDAERFRAPVRAYTDWLKESRDFIQFVNPGDLRVVERTCGQAGCHVQESRNVRTSMMTHGAMLWEAGLYNNGGIPYKDAKFGESYGPNGEPQRIRTWPPPTPEETKTKGILPYLDPIQRWEVSEPGNLLRAFERGGEKRPEVGIPSPEEDPGRPDIKLADRGIGTELRTDPVFLGLQKTRLLDPLLSFPGTNDHPGDYRGSGCTGCHVVYANDLDPEHSSTYVKYGHNGNSASVDPTINKSEPGHPIQHLLTKSIPSSSCMVCHVHPGTNMETTYFGYTFWDHEADGDKGMYPAKQKNPTAEQYHEVQLSNPEGSAAKGNWSDLNFLKNIYTNVNPKTQYTKFADFHSHGWIFRAVFKRDRYGNMLDENGEIIDFKDPKKFEKAVQLKDIHLEKGMHCVDCHFTQDVHGNGKIYGETRNAIEIGCEDCHGTITQRATLKTSGPAAPGGGTNLAAYRTPWKQPRFYWSGGRLFQRSNLEENKQWEVVQVLDTITPGNAHYSEKSAYAKTVLKDGKTWGDLTKMHGDNLAHSNSRMTCYTCHSSWTTSCFGCHLTMTANQKMPMLHNEGINTRNYTTYNFQVLRDDVYMLGIDGTVTGNRVAPVRSACAIVVSSQNANRDWIYYGQQTISTPGFSGEAFSTYVPHTVRATETKQCTDCHVSASNNNNAWLAQIMLHGTNFLNYMGRYIYVAAGNDGYEAIPYAEHSEPNAVYGSDLHKLAYPANYKNFVAHGREIKESYEHKGKVLDVQFRGEYLYAATGEGGFRAFDIAQIDVKDFSERMTTAPVSPLGQRLYVKTKYATAIASPSTLAVDPLRNQLAENEEQKIHLIYGFLYVADKYEGLVVIGNKLTDNKHLPGVGTLLDGDPRNNFLARAATFNPNGALNGARRITIIGVYAYMLCDKGLEVVDLNDPLHPKLVAEVPLHDPHGIDFQFRYAFITDADGMKVLDITHRDHPVLVPEATVALPDARNVYVARTYAYVSAGKQGIAIINVERPDHPGAPTFFNANGALNDVNDLKISMTASSQFAFVADGKNGMRVLQLFSPDDQPKFYGFSPEPTPRLIATHKMKGEALAISKGMDRDRAVDEDGNQIAVFGRRGARPFNKEELERLYLKNGALYTVTDTPPGSSTANSNTNPRAASASSTGKR